MIKIEIHYAIILGILISFLLIIPTSMSDNDVNNVSHVGINDKSASILNNSTITSHNISVNSYNHNADKKIIDSVKIKNNRTISNTNVINNIKKINQTSDNELSNTKLHNHSPELDSGAVIRAFYVFVGLSVIVMAYLIFRSFRLRSSPAQMVRKYGVLAHKQDIEMRPLPLDDDDDDDTTVFDASRLSLHSNQIA